MFATWQEIVLVLWLRRKVFPEKDAVPGAIIATHSGDILFRNLKERPLSEEDQRVMDEWIEEHDFGRWTTKALLEANTRYRHGDESALADIVSKLQTIVGFYPGHIEKEDKIFFPHPGPISRKKRSGLCSRSSVSLTGRIQV